MPDDRTARGFGTRAVKVVTHAPTIDQGPAAVPMSAGLEGPAAPMSDFDGALAVVVEAGIAA